MRFRHLLLVAAIVYLTLKIIGVISSSDYPWILCLIGWIYSDIRWIYSNIRELSSDIEGIKKDIKGIKGEFDKHLRGHP